MKANIICAGTKMPDWVNKGSEEYIKRIPKPGFIKVLEVPLLKRQDDKLPSIIEKEGNKMLALIPKQSLVIALDRQGEQYSSEKLAGLLAHEQQRYPSFSFLIGGPEGLSKACLKEAKYHWSLSKLTLPHPLARLMLCEALYRAWSINAGLPYHK